MAKKFRRKQVPTIGTVTDLIKQKNVGEALHLLLKMAKPKDVALLLYAELNNSKYKAYSSALNRFNYVISDFLKSEDKNILLAYSQELSKEIIKSDMHYSYFFEIRNLIIDILITNVLSYNSRIEYVLTIINLISDEDDAAYTNVILNFVCNLAETVWPEESKPLKVLYGKK